MAIITIARHAANRLVSLAHGQYDQRERNLSVAIYINLVENPPRPDIADVLTLLTSWRRV